MRNCVGRVNGGEIREREILRRGNIGLMKKPGIRGDSHKSIRMTPPETPSNSGYIA